MRRVLTGLDGLNGTLRGAIRVAEHADRVNDLQSFRDVGWDFLSLFAITAAGIWLDASRLLGRKRRLGL